MQSLVKKQILPITLDDAWEFFSDPRNLGKITPASMNFRITSDLGDGGVYPGMIITYRVSPLAGIPMTWVTEITQVRDKAFFIDNQLKGPYQFWHHQHLFREIPGGTEMTDILHYAAPFGILGTLMEKLFIRRKVEGIFAYREEILRKYFQGK
jgi:ligand-binding SRPBCC domain-containing protein